MAFVEDLSLFFKDFVVPATSGAFSTSVIFDAPDADVLQGRAMSNEYAITYPRGALGALAYGSLVTVGPAPLQGVPSATVFKVRKVDDVQDGAVQRALLEKP